METIVIIAKQPPGGRCDLYGRYAEALAPRLGCRWEMRPATPDAPVPPPAMRVDGVAIEPADGLILSPGDIAAHLRPALGEAAALALVELLEDARERWMDEVEGAS